MKNALEPFCPSMKPKTIALFIRFKHLKKGTLLLDFNNAPVLDVFDNPILCQGMCEQMGAVIGVLHAV
jgi:hypothetical protein